MTTAVMGDTVQGMNTETPNSPDPKFINLIRTGMKVVERSTGEIVFIQSETTGTKIRNGYCFVCHGVEFSSELESKLGQYGWMEINRLRKHYELHPDEVGVPNTAASPNVIANGLQLKPK